MATPSSLTPIIFPDRAAALPTREIQPQQDNTLTAAFDGLLNAANDINATNANNLFIRNKANQVADQIDINADLEPNQIISAGLRKQAANYRANAQQQTFNPFQTPQQQSTLLSQALQDLGTTAQGISKRQNEQQIILSKRDSALDQISARGNESRSTDAASIGLRSELERLKSKLRQEVDNNQSTLDTEEDIKKTENNLKEIEARGGFDIQGRTISASGRGSSRSPNADDILSRSSLGSQTNKFVGNQDTIANVRNMVGVLSNTPQEMLDGLQIDPAEVLAGINRKDGRFLADARGQKSRDAMLRLAQNINEEILFEASQQAPETRTDVAPSSPQRQQGQQTGPLPVEAPSGPDATFLGGAAPEQKGNVPPVQQAQQAPLGGPGSNLSVPVTEGVALPQLTEDQAIAIPAPQAFGSQQQPTGQITPGQRRAVTGFLANEPATQAGQASASSSSSGNSQQERLARRAQVSQQVSDDQIAAIQNKIGAGTATDEEKKLLNDISRFIQDGTPIGSPDAAAPVDRKQAILDKIRGNTRS